MPATQPRIRFPICSANFKRTEQRTNYGRARALSLALFFLEESGSTAAGGAGEGLCDGVSGRYGKFFVERRKTLKNFVQPERHIADGIGWCVHARGKSGFLRQKLGVAKHGRKRITYVRAHLEHVTAQSRLGFRHGADLIGIVTAGFGLAAAQNFTSDKSCHSRPDYWFSTQLDDGSFSHI